MKKDALLALVVVLLWFPGMAADAQTPVAAPQYYDIGLIFNTDNLLLDLESYQGGVGVKVSGDKLAYRLLVDFFYSSETDAIDVSLGGAIERHLGAGRVQPYLGGSLTGGYAKAEGGGVKTVSVLTTVGGLFGVEFYVLRFLSVFAEYELSLTMNYTKTETNVGGVEISDDRTDWTVQMGAGNQSKIGIVFYFQQGRDLHLEPTTNGRR